MTILGRRRRDPSERGLTIVELVIVFAIIGVLSVIAIPIYGSYVDRQNKRTAINDLALLQSDIAHFTTEFKELPNDLNGIAPPGLVDPWGNPYEYLNLQSGDPGVNGQARKDKNLVPINSDYDLYSKGKDGETTPALTAQKSLDDIVRANDGAFVGLAANY
jgi:general secretion pathway protein G